MPNISDKQVTRLATLLVGLQDLLESLKPEGYKLTPAQQAHIDEWSEKGLCLVCDQPLEGETRRGSHQSCYNGIMLDIKQGKLTTQQAIEEGHFDPNTKTPGRKGRRRKVNRATAKLALDVAKKNSPKFGTKGGSQKP